MYGNMNILGLIPARGGSKGLPGKNLRILSGRPLIAWTIEEAIESVYLDAVVVSTDDAAIAEIGRACGAEVPFLRPKEISGDRARRIDAVFHALDCLATQGRLFDAVMLLQPTSPLRTSSDIDCAIEYMAGKGASAVISVCKDPHPPFWSNMLPEDRCMKDFLSSHVLGKNRQELEIYYRLSGAIFLARVDYLRQQGEFLGPQTYAYEMPTAWSVDIDSELDLVIAEALLNRRKKIGASI